MTALQPGERDADSYVQRARDNYCDDDTEIDDAPNLSHAPEGVWVAAWVWVSDAEMEDDQ